MHTYFRRRNNEIEYIFSYNPDSCPYSVSLSLSSVLAFMRFVSHVTQFENERITIYPYENIGLYGSEASLALSTVLVYDDPNAILIVQCLDSGGQTLRTDYVSDFEIVAMLAQGWTIINDLYTDD